MQVHPSQAQNKGRGVRKAAGRQRCLRQPLRGEAARACGALEAARSWEEVFSAQRVMRSRGGTRSDFLKALWLLWTERSGKPAWPGHLTVPPLAFRNLDQQQQQKMNRAFMQARQYPQW